ncbi:MAG: DUF61 family protein [Methanosarcinales archaeon]|nr:DUF61 family protein [Methanosarcinales archaeon]
MPFNADRKVIIKTIQTMNQHLPSKRKTLAELLEEEKPGIRGKDNTFYIMDKAELELISQNVPRYYWKRIRLPLLIEMSPDLGSGSARVQGEVESELVSKLLGLKKGYDKFIVIYLPDVRELRRKLPTTSQYAFVTSLREEY